MRSGLEIRPFSIAQLQTKITFFYCQNLYLLFFFVSSAYCKAGHTKRAKSCCCDFSCCYCRYGCHCCSWLDACSWPRDEIFNVSLNSCTALQVAVTPSCPKCPNLNKKVSLGGKWPDIAVPGKYLLPPLNRGLSMPGCSPPLCDAYYSHGQSRPLAFLNILRRTPNLSKLGQKG